MPPANGGTNFGPENIHAIFRSRDAFAEGLVYAQGGDLTELKEEALRGLQYQRDRVSATDQRASFFLGAAGLSTSLVLANAGLLVGTGRLHAPWLGLAVGALGMASISAVVAGFRAIQATMFDFGRMLPHNAMRRRELTGDELARAYTANLLAAETRERAIADWKGDRLRSARRWFLGAMTGVVLLTVFVLVEAL
jgi:hypothetical protein